MTVPGRISAARLLLTLDPPPWFVRHSRAVAEVAAWLARRIDAAGTPIDRAFVEGGALLHDVDKLLPDSDPARRLAHGAGSAEWLTRHGHPELAVVVADHPVTRLADGAWFGRWLASAPVEARVVAYADKRAGQRVERLGDRFASWERRYPLGEDGWTAAVRRAVRERAERLEEDVCRLAGARPDDVRRLRWTNAALVTARTRAGA